jgi:hypothetical protein
MQEDEEEQTCPECGQTQWTVCPGCLGLGCRLIRDGSCSHCGQTVSHWQRCSKCSGAGKVYLLDACRHAPAASHAFRPSHSLVDR